MIVLIQHGDNIIVILIPSALSYFVKLEVPNRQYLQKFLKNLFYVTIQMASYLLNIEDKQELFAMMGLANKVLM